MALKPGFGEGTKSSGMPIRKRKPAKPSPLVGKWRLVEMEQWDEDFIDLVETGHILFKRGGSGQMAFGAVHLTLDWVPGEDDRVEFTFEGFDEMDEVSGRGWAAVVSGVMGGAIYFRWGQASTSLGEKWPARKAHP